MGYIFDGEAQSPWQQLPPTVRPVHPYGAPVFARRRVTAMNEEDRWVEFWRSVAAIWVALPPEIQAEYAQRYPRGENRLRG
ncbi:hypothetical protein [Paenarthrobacter sp. CAP02]|uniref:hypothetical protein n=1 Tax=Paenarthrobacter sp. CAP02 TaxID=3158144 RepID=UPI0032DB6FEF